MDVRIGDIILIRDDALEGRAIWVGRGFRGFEVIWKDTAQANLRSVIPS